MICLKMYYELQYLEVVFKTAPIFWIWFASCFFACMELICGWSSSSLSGWRINYGTVIIDKLYIESYEHFNFTSNFRYNSNRCNFKWRFICSHPTAIEMFHNYGSCLIRPNPLIWIPYFDVLTFVRKKHDRCSLLNQNV